MLISFFLTLIKGQSWDIDDNWQPDELIKRQFSRHLDCFRITPLRS